MKNLSLLKDIGIQPPLRCCGLGKG